MKTSTLTLLGLNYNSKMFSFFLLATLADSFENRFELGLLSIKNMHKERVCFSHYYLFYSWHILPLFFLFLLLSPSHTSDLITLSFFICFFSISLLSELHSINKNHFHFRTSSFSITHVNPFIPHYDYLFPFLLIFRNQYRYLYS